MSSLSTRKELENAVYLVSVYSNNRKLIFDIDDDCLTYINILRKAKRKYRFYLHAYCMMPDHVHLLVQARHTGSLAKIMHTINLSYSKYHNIRYNAVGHLWAGRYKSLLVDGDHYALVATLHIEKNPQRRNGVGQAETYRWSSYAYHALGASCDLVDEHEHYSCLGNTHHERSLQYREIFKEVNMSIHDFLISDRKVLGDRQFENDVDKKIAEKVRRQNIYAGRGRPRKIELSEGDKKLMVVGR